MRGIVARTVPPESLSVAAPASAQPTPEDLRAAGLTEEEWAWACEAMEGRLDPDAARRAAPHS